ncbi:MAG: c-type cytochrome [Rhodoferax sp.]|nr:c-type cytochrome [Rhodoferax sp.]
MSSFRDALMAALVWGLAGAALAQATPYVGIGRAATPAELAAWDIDVRPDFKGLPKGSGSVAQGMEVWEGKCASCHGIFGESNEVFTPLTGGTTKEDIQSGRVARLTDPAFPGRTTMMKLSQLSTLWDYINRAMPWNAPKSLTTDEVYAVTAYLLNLGGVLPEGSTLSDRNMSQVQEMLPNRNGLTTDHGLWPGKTMGNAKADVAAVACMKDCAPAGAVTSSLPDFARNAHGNLAEQNRLVGPQRGANTTVAAATTPVGAAPAAAAPAATATATTPARPAAPKAGAADAAAIALTQKHACVACHGMDKKILGPGFQEIARKYAARADGLDYLAGKIKSGGAGVWGAVPMPAQTLAGSEAKQIAQWLMDGARK